MHKNEGKYRTPTNIEKYIKQKIINNRITTLE